MTQSVELVLNRAAEQALTAEWDRLAEAGLPTERRAVPSPSHRPHVTLAALDTVEPAAEAALPSLFADLDLPVRVGGLLVFGPRRTQQGRGSYVLVRQVVPSAGLLALQARVAALLGLTDHPHFGPGCWTPHLTVARRVSSDDVGPMLDVLAGSRAEGPATIRRARRWDSEVKRTWWVSGPS